VFKFIRVILGMPSKSEAYEEAYESLSSEFTTKLEEAYADMHADIQRTEENLKPNGYLSVADLKTHSWGIRFTKQSGEVEWYNPRDPWGPIPTLLSEGEARMRVSRYKTQIVAEKLAGRDNWGIRYTHGNGQVAWWHHPVDKVAWGSSSNATVFTEEKAKEKAAYFISGGGRCAGVVHPSTRLERCQTITRLKT